MKKRLEISAFTLRLIAMITMLCDHLWGTIIPGNDWLTCVGRLAFPIFAFQIVEGYFRTRDFKRYVMRLLIFALLSEIPFNLAIGGRWIYPFHQNVLWSFLLSLGLIHINAKQKGKHLLHRIAVGIGTAVLGYMAGLLTMVDYFHAGVLTVLVFYFARPLGIWRYVAELAGLWYINLELLGGLVYEFSLFGYPVSFHQQGIALLALPLIWLYRGKQGYHNRWVQLGCYAFYPAHLLILGLLRMM